MALNMFDVLRSSSKNNTSVYFYDDRLCAFLSPLETALSRRLERTQKSPLPLTEKGTWRKARCATQSATLCNVAVACRQLRRRKRSIKRLAVRAW